MAEKWLHSNRRVTWIGALPPLAVATCGFVLAASWLGHPESWSVRGLGWAIGVLGGLLAAIWIYVMQRPRLAYDDGHLLVNLRVHGSVRVPIDVVECFFMGQGRSHLAGPGGQRFQTVNVIVRLAERAAEWKEVPVHPVLGTWSDGYIIIRGMWCEPLSEESLNRLNARLAQIKRDRRSDAPSMGTEP